MLSRRIKWKNLISAASYNRFASDRAAGVMPKLTDTFQPVNKQLNALYLICKQGWIIKN